MFPPLAALRTGGTLNDDDEGIPVPDGSDEPSLSNDPLPLPIVRTTTAPNTPEQQELDAPDDDANDGEVGTDLAEQILEDAWELSRALPRLLRSRRSRIDTDTLWDLSDQTRGLRAHLRQRRDELDFSILRRQTVRLEELAGRHLGYRRRTAFQDFAETLLVAVCVAVFIRTFLFEAFRIPTPSMVPTLLVGDQIFVAKFIYGIRLPFSEQRIFNWRTPARGEVIVFEYPYKGENSGKDFIKRVIAVSGDTVRVEDNIALVNGKPLGELTVSARRTQCQVEPGELCTFRNTPAGEPGGALGEEGAGCLCTLLRNETANALWWTQHIAAGTTCRCTLSRADRNNPSWPDLRSLSTFTYGWGDEGGRPYQQPLPGGGFEMKIPDGFLFVMGDNRDQSDDSRSWGLVPVERVIGKALIIWWSSPGQRDDRLFTFVH